LSAWSSLRLACPRCAGTLRCEEAGAVCLACAAAYPLAEGVLDLSVGRRGAAGFHPEYFQRLESFEQRHFWFAARRRMVLMALRRAVPDLAGRHLFDIGCGGGDLARFLADNGVALAGCCDPYLEALGIAHRKLQAPLVLVNEGRLPPLGFGQDLVGMFDVLEHIDDDVGTLEHLASVLVPGGVLVLTVPAHGFLFDEMDELAYHRRRYDRPSLRDKLERAGFRIRLLTHFMSPLVPMLLVVRTVGRWWVGGRQRPMQRRALELRRVPLVNGAVGLLMDLERQLLRHLSLPLGSSLIAVAERPSAA
jgi:SAM-dependent methyltransferase